jgi:hypothetical protein
MRHDHDPGAKMKLWRIPTNMDAIVVMAESAEEAITLAKECGIESMRPQWSQCEPYNSKWLGPRVVIIGEW